MTEQAYHLLMEKYCSQTGIEYFSWRRNKVNSFIGADHFSVSGADKLCCPSGKW